MKKQNLVTNFDDLTGEKIVTSEEEKIEKSEIESKYIIVRRSIVFLANRFVLVELIYAVLFIFIFSFFIFIIKEVSTTTIIFTTFIVSLFSFIKILFIIYLVYAWNHDYYKIYPKQIMHIKSILRIQEESYNLKDCRRVQVEQGYIGKILNFGNIRISVPHLKKDFIMFEIPNPIRYADIVRDFVNSFTKETLSFR